MSKSSGNNVSSILMSFAVFIYLIFALQPVVGQERDAEKSKAEAKEMKSDATRMRGENNARGNRARGREWNVEVKDPAAYNQAQENPVFSGPQPSEPLPSFTVKGAVGELANQEFDPVAMADGKPSILFFMDDTGVGVRGLAQVSRLLPNIRSKSNQELPAFVIFLTDDPTTMASKVRNYSRAIPEFTIGISEDGRDGPGAYGLNRNISETIVFAKDSKVTRNFVFPQGMLYPDPHVMGAVAEVLGVERETLAKWLSENAAEGEGMMRGGDNNPQQTLRDLLGRFVREGKLTREEAGQIFRAAFPPPKERERGR